MLDPSKRFLTVVLLLGIAVLVTAISFGEHAGDRVIGQVTEKRLDSIAPVTVTPAPVEKSASPYGPNWKRTEVMSAAEDPQFPDPRVPPLPLPTPPPPPKVRPTPKRITPTATPTPNLNIPIWRRAAPLPTATPVELASPGEGTSPSPSPSNSPQP
ncbi:MAG TPA: hypothetical protein VFE17_09775 [Candidatus Baltobacteraceae bacterium]|nr:hypothetical protein [Candidatus Baltobacteraceae bacterium]